MKAQQTTVIERVVINKSVPAIQVTMSEEEAKALLAVCDFVGGKPKTTRRGHIDAFVKALWEAGVRSGNHNTADVDRSATGCISFK